MIRGVRAGAVLMAIVFSSGTQPADLALYRQAVAEYRAGQMARAVSPTLADAAADAQSGWLADDLAAAAMLHTDVLVALVKQSRFADARLHLDAAVALLKASVERDPSRVEFARRWRATVAALLHAYGARDMGAQLRTVAMPWLIDTNGQMTAQAAFEAGLASEIRAAVAGPLSGATPKNNDPLPIEARRELTVAAKRFEEALVADPACAEAALHLGRVRLLDGREVDAAQTLLKAAAAPGLPIRYLAALMLGVVAERQSRFAEAETKYRAALAMFHWGESAPLALSHLLMRVGRDTEAREALAAHLTSTQGRVVEPLRTYLAQADTDLGPTLDLLRAQVWR